jgi:hypothetical protein
MAEAHFDCIDLLSDKDALMSVGYRAFTAQWQLAAQAGQALGPCLL